MRSAIIWSFYAAGIWTLVHPLAGQAGQLRGTVTDAAGHPLPNATIEILGTTHGTTTDARGRYLLPDLPADRFSLRASHIGYRPDTRTVDPASTPIPPVDFALAGAVLTADGLTVTAAKLASGQAKAFNAQHTALHIKNVVSRELFSRFPDRNAAETVQRLPGVALDRDQGEGEFIQVRGLNAQLNSVTVNGQRIPNPTADIENGRAVGLNMLQIDNAETIEIVKALTPDLDADAMGGAVDLVLKRAPAAPELSFGIATGFNQQVARFDRWDNRLGELSASAGRRFRDGRLGLIGGASLSHTGRGSQLSELGYQTPGGRDVEYNLWNDYDIRRRRLGLLAGADYAFADGHQLRLSYTYNVFRDDELRRRRRFLPAGRNEQIEIRNRLEDQRFAMLEVAGQHRFSAWTFDYAHTRARASEELPDRTYFLFQRPNPYLDSAGAELSAADLAALDLETPFPGLDPLPLYRVRADEKEFTERDWSARLDAGRPFALGDRRASFKTGAKIWRKKKRTRELRQEYKPDGAIDTTAVVPDFPFVDLRSDDPEFAALFPPDRFSFRPQLFNYNAAETIYAGYAMGTLAWTPRLSALAGLRAEFTRHAYRHRAAFVESDESYLNLLPSLHLTYRLADRSNLRLALTSALARPEYTRLIPHTTPPDDGLILRGNPGLVAARAYGVDLLLESFPGDLGLISAGFFAKRILDPVVRHTIDRPPFRILTPVNGESGSLWGVELALSRRLADRDWPLLRHTHLYANYTFNQAEMDYGTLRADSGPLPGNARHTANVGLFYENPGSGRALTLSYNYRDAMFKELADDPRDDLWFGAERRLDLSAHQQLSPRWRLFLQINNATDQDEREFFGGPDGRRRQRETFGRAGMLGVKYGH